LNLQEQRVKPAAIGCRIHFREKEGIAWGVCRQEQIRASGERR